MPKNNKNKESATESISKKLKIVAIIACFIGGIALFAVNTTNVDGENLLGIKTQIPELNIAPTPDMDRTLSIIFWQSLGGGIGSILVFYLKPIFVTLVLAQLGTAASIVLGYWNRVEPFLSFVVKTMLPMMYGMIFVVPGMVLGIVMAIGYIKCGNFLKSLI